MALPDGLYDLLLTESLASRLDLSRADVLADALARQLAADDRSATAAQVVDLVALPLRVLKALHGDRQFPLPPEIGLAVPWLFTAGKGSPSLLQEIRRELASADQVDILVSFITVSGVRKLHDVLQQITAMGAQGRGSKRLRVLTTTYCSWHADAGLPGRRAPGAGGGP